jgi:dipeptidase E
MVNLAFYSDQIIAANAAVDLRLLPLLNKAAGTRIAYIASGPEPDRQFFNGTRAYYARYGFDLAIFHDLDEPHRAEDRDVLFGCAAIHLTGGHTAGFLERLKRAAMLDPLRAWAREGGTLIGTSAGAILMTPTIAVDALFSDNAPENVSNGAALDLVPFEFFPHLNADTGYLAALLRYSRHTPRPIAACNDGDGIVVTCKIAECIGDLTWIIDGRIEHIGDIKLGDFRIVRAG